MKHTDCFFTIEVEGAEYRCALTNGALLRFAETTGHEFGTPGTSQLRDSLAIIHACAVSGAEREGKEFPLTLMELADHTSPADLAAFARTITDILKPTGTAPAAGAKKKSSPSSSSKALPSE